MAKTVTILVFYSSRYFQKPESQRSCELGELTRCELWQDKKKNNTFANGVEACRRKKYIYIYKKNQNKYHIIKIRERYVIFQYLNPFEKLEQYLKHI